MIRLLDGMVTQGEGDINLFEDRQEILTQLLIHIKPKNIVEIGFNLGASCKLMLDVLLPYKIEHMYIFDICDSGNTIFKNGMLYENYGGQHSYVENNFNILKEYYQINMELIKGDSLLTVKPFMDNLNQEVDFIEVDGFHEGETPYLDIQNTIGKLRKGGVIYLDDYNDTYTAIKNAVDKTDWSDFYTYYPGHSIFYAIRKGAEELCSGCI